MLEKYPIEIEEYMRLYADSLNERDRRRYAAVEVAKLPHGGLQYICNLLSIDPKTVRVGQSELEKKKLKCPDRSGLGCWSAIY